MAGKQIADVETDVIDPVVDALLHHPDFVCNDNVLSDAREQFNRDTIILLLGLGLSGEEIQLFQKHEIGLEKFSTLTLSDLDYIGIKSVDKKKQIMDCIYKILKQNKEKLQELHVSQVCSTYKSEDFQAMDNVLRHQQTLVKIIPYLERNLISKSENTFFQPGISVNHTFEKVVLCCVQQAHQVHSQLCSYLIELGQVKSHQQKKKKQSKKLFKNWWLLPVVAASFIPLFVWGSRNACDIHLKGRALVSHPGIA